MNKLIFVFVMALFCGCQNEPKTATNKKVPDKTSEANKLVYITGDIQKTNWLLGRWRVNLGNDLIMYEEWKKNSELIYNGRSYMLNEGDTNLFETIQIRQIKDSLFYAPAVLNQNEGREISFQLTFLSDTAFVFENPNHDFPKRIAYTKVSNDSLVAIVSGKSMGIDKKEKFEMKKVRSTN